MKLIKHFMLSFFLLLSQTVLAEPAWYQVELIVFQNTQPQNESQVLSHAALPQTDNAIQLIPFEEKNYYRPFELMPNAAKHLNKEESRLNSSAEFKVLLHTAWLQDLSNPEESKAIHLSAKADNEDEHWALDGTVTFLRRKYIELNTNLLLNLDTDAEDTKPIRLVQHRKLRSKELHYLDNPQMGVLVKVTPYG